MQVDEKSAIKINLLVTINQETRQYNVTERTVTNANLDVYDFDRGDFPLNSNSVYEFEPIGNNTFKFSLLQLPETAPFFVNNFDVKIIGYYPRPYPSLYFNLNNQSLYSVLLTIVFPEQYSTIVDSIVCLQSQNTFIINNPFEPDAQDGLTDRQIPEICGNVMDIIANLKQYKKPMQLYPLII